MKSVLTLLMLGLLSVATLAQSGAQSRPPLEREPVAPGPNPQQRAEGLLAENQDRLVDALFVKLQEAKSEQEAETLDDALTALWVRRGGTTSQLLLEWAQEEFAQQKPSQALDYLDALLILEPNNFEGYYRRAVTNYQAKDLGRALNDLGRTLSLEPRHYGALGTLGTVLSELGRDKEALEAFRAAQKLIPRRSILMRHIERLTPKVDGRPG